MVAMTRRQASKKQTGKKQTGKKPALQTLRASSIRTLTDAQGEMSGLQLLYDIHGRQIAVMLSYDAPSDYDQRDISVSAQYLDRLEEAGWWSDGAENPDNAMKRAEALHKEIEEAVNNVCYDTFMELTGPPPLPALLPENKKSASEGEILGEEQQQNSPFTSSPPQQTLHDYMYPESFVLQLVSQKGHLKGIHRQDTHGPTQWPAHSDISEAEKKVELKVPIYTPSQIRVVRSFLFHRWVLVVSTPDGKLLCCKLSAGHGESFLREYHALRKIQNAGCTTESLHVPQLRGLIHTDTRHHGEEGIVGILVDYVDTERYDLAFHLAPAFLPSVLFQGGDATDGKILTNQDGEISTTKPPTHKATTTQQQQQQQLQQIPNIDPARRQKWSSQIQSIVHKLHALDIVWGDAKTANILLDRNDDLWVIDFGGGTTEGWIDLELENTKKGDLQALNRILEEIGGQRRVWRCDERPSTN